MSTYFQMLMDAYIRGNQWAHENGLNADGLPKAAYDYADKTLSALETEAVEPVLWWVIETMPSGVKRWQCVEHKYDAQKRADDSPYPATVTPLYAHPPHSSIPTVTGEMVERAWKAQREYHQSREISYGPDGVRAGLIAALSSESKP